jgi:tetratricopeptide (TPR) repeat protein
MQFLNHPARIESLRQEDFQLFYSSFKEEIKEKISHMEELFFFVNGAAAAKYIESPSILEKVVRFFNEKERGNSVCCVDQSIIFNIPVKNGQVVAVISGLDSYFTEHVSTDWLADFCNAAGLSFLQVKRAGIDLETQLLNSRQFHATLKQFPASSAPSVLLVELFPRARSSREAEIHKAKAVRSLKGCIGGKIPLFYLGNHVFGLIVGSMERENCHALGLKLLSWLRRDGFRKIHIGIDRHNESGPVNLSNMYKSTVEQAYFALQTATRRGPFSVCVYDRLRHPEKHPLRKPSQPLPAKFRRRWAGLVQFSIVLFRPARKDDIAIIIAGLGDDTVILGEEDVYVLLPAVPPRRALQWSEELLSSLKLGDVQIGVAYYPHSSFTKSETLFNCRKALQHAAFFGPGGSAIFDAVSLNVSGDIYYAEGDLTSAVKEYRAGLECNPTDTNLLNSLGVSYADMDKHREAQHCFERVLSLDGTNFMALYNAGLGADLKGNTVDAVDYFERAYRLETDFSEVKDDLAFHLGRLYCRIGRNSEAIGILLPWYRNGANSKYKERALPYLGRAYHGLGKNNEAVKWLQRALKYNEFDAESMGLLGLIYLINKEGDDIALTLCEKSVDIMPDNIILQMYLAKARMACNLHSEARATLNKCLRNKTTRLEAQLFSALNYKKEGQPKRAGFWINKLLNNDNLDENIAAQAYAIREEIDGF